MNQDDSPVSHPKHYNDHPSGIECITITRHMNFNIGNAIKYLWRCKVVFWEKERWGQFHALTILKRCFQT